MQMNKNQMTMAVIGGVAGLLSVVLGYLAFAEGDAQDKAQRTIRAKTNLYDQNRSATEEQRELYAANEKAEAEWTKAAYAAVAKQDERLYAEEITAEGLVRKMQDARVAYAQKVVDGPKLPGSDESPKFIHAEFMFGTYFQPYLNGDPIKGEAKKVEVQRRWGDVCQVADILLACGAQSLDGVEVIEPEKPTDSSNGNYGAEEEEKPEAYPILTETYKITFKASPAALVKVLNAFSTEKRFISVDQMSFSQAGDPLLAKFGGAGKAEQSSGRRRRRREAATEEESEQEKKKIGLITDPEQELVPFTVTMTLSTLTATAQAKTAQEETDQEVE